MASKKAKRQYKMRYAEGGPIKEDPRYAANQLAGQGPVGRANSGRLTQIDAAENAALQALPAAAPVQTPAPAPEPRKKFLGLFADGGGIGPMGFRVSKGFSPWERDVSGNLPSEWNRDASGQLPSEWGRDAQGNLASTSGGKRVDNTSQMLGSLVQNDEGGLDLFAPPKPITPKVEQPKNYGLHFADGGAVRYDSIDYGQQPYDAIEPNLRAGLRDSSIPISRAPVGNPWVGPPRYERVGHVSDLVGMSAYGGRVKPEGMSSTEFTKLSPNQPANMSLGRDTPAPKGPTSSAPPPMDQDQVGRTRGRSPEQGYKKESAAPAPNVSAPTPSADTKFISELPTAPTTVVGSRADGEQPAHGLRPDNARSPFPRPEAPMPSLAVPDVTGRASGAGRVPPPVLDVPDATGLRSGAGRMPAPELAVPDVTGGRHPFNESQVPMQYVRVAATKYGIPPEIAEAQIHTESRGNPKAIGPPTKRGASEGLAQILPSTGKAYGVKDPFNPVEASDFYGRYMKDMLKQHNGNMDEALAAYNTGPGNLAKAKQRANAKGTDWRTELPQETKDYLSRINQRADENRKRKYADGGQIWGGPETDNESTRIHSPIYKGPGGKWDGMPMFADGGGVGTALAQRGHQINRKGLRGGVKDGMFYGEGGPTEDKVHIRASPGEFIIPDDSRRKIGTANLRAMVAATHTPVHLRRGLRDGGHVPQFIEGGEVPWYKKLGRLGLGAARDTYGLAKKIVTGGSKKIADIVGPDPNSPKVQFAAQDAAQDAWEKAAAGPSKDRIAAFNAKLAEEQARAASKAAAQAAGQAAGTARATAGGPAYQPNWTAPPGGSVPPSAGAPGSATPTGYPGGIGSQYTPPPGPTSGGVGAAPGTPPPGGSRGTMGVGGAGGYRPPPPPPLDLSDWWNTGKRGLQAVGGLNKMLHGAGWAATPAIDAVLTGQDISKLPQPWTDPLAYLRGVQGATEAGGATAGAMLAQQGLRAAPGLAKLIGMAGLGYVGHQLPTWATHAAGEKTASELINERYPDQVGRGTGQTPEQTKAILEKTLPAALAGEYADQASRAGLRTQPGYNLPSSDTDATDLKAPKGGGYVSFTDNDAVNQETGMPGKRLISYNDKNPVPLPYGVSDTSTPEEKAADKARRADWTAQSKAIDDKNAAAAAFEQRSLRDMVQQNQVNTSNYELREGLRSRDPAAVTAAMNTLGQVKEDRTRQTALDAKNADAAAEVARARMGAEALIQSHGMTAQATLEAARIKAQQDAAQLAATEGRANRQDSAKDLEERHLIPGGKDPKTGNPLPPVRNVVGEQQERDYFEANASGNKEWLKKNFGTTDYSSLDPVEKRTAQREFAKMMRLNAAMPVEAGDPEIKGLVQGMKVSPLGLRDIWDTEGSPTDNDISLRQGLSTLIPKWTGLAPSEVNQTKVTAQYPGRRLHNVVFGELIGKDPEMAMKVIEQVAATEGPEQAKKLYDMYVHYQSGQRK